MSRFIVLVILRVLGVFLASLLGLNMSINLQKGKWSLMD